MLQKRVYILLSSILILISRKKVIKMELANRQTNRNRRVECDVCRKSMRSDHLKRHKQTHKDLLALPDNEIKKELEKRQEKIRKLGKLRKRMA